MDAKQLRDGDLFDITGTLFKAFRQSIDALMLNIWTFLGLVFVPFLLFVYALPFVFLPLLTGNDAGKAASLILALVLGFVICILSLLFVPAIVVTQIASARDEKLDFKDAISIGMPYVVRNLGLAILSGGVVLIGLVLFIVPGLLALFFLSFAPYILVDKNTGIVEAMKSSYEMVKKYWKVTFGLLIVSFVISLPSYIPVVGQMISLGLSIAYFCLSALVYIKIVGKKGTAVKKR
jgi:uncharacterized membrane protein